MAGFFYAPLKRSPVKGLSVGIPQATNGATSRVATPHLFSMAIAAINKSLGGVVIWRRIIILWIGLFRPNLLWFSLSRYPIGWSFLLTLYHWLRHLLTCSANPTVACREQYILWSWFYIQYCKRPLHNYVTLEGEWVVRSRVGGWCPSKRYETLREWV